MDKLPLEIEIEREVAANKTLVENLGHRIPLGNYEQWFAETVTEIKRNARIETGILRANIDKLEVELKAERDLRASIAADLRKISEQFNKLIASK